MKAGELFERCPACLGDGAVTSTSGGVWVCARCGGQRRARNYCDTCLGSGYMLGRARNFAGKKALPERLTCKRCRGTGIEPLAGA